MAKKHGVPLHETPVGFKYIGELIMQDKIAIGGEESAGLSIRHHVPEKDGILAGLSRSKVYIDMSTVSPAASLATSSRRH